MARGVIVRRPTPLMSCAAVLAVLVTLALAAPAAAVLIPSPSAEAAASARSANNDAGTQTNQGAPAAEAENSLEDPDTAEAEARAALGGDLGSRSLASGASGSDLSTRAAAAASWVANFNTFGSANSGSSVGIDFNIAIDGALTLDNNNSNAGLNGIFANAAVTLRAIGQSGTATVFDGSARLLTEQDDRPPILSRFGGWADSSRDNDFNIEDCDAFSCEVAVEAQFIFDSAFIVNLGQIFAIELILSTEAFIFGGFEIEAEADFFDTVSVALTTSTPGVTVAQVSGGPITPAPVPEPGSLALLTAGLAGFAWLRRRNRQHRPGLKLK